MDLLCSLHFKSLATQYRYGLRKLRNYFDRAPFCIFEQLRMSPKICGFQSRHTVNYVL